MYQNPAALGNGEAARGGEREREGGMHQPPSAARMHEVEQGRRRRMWEILRQREIVRGRMTGG